MPSAESSTVRPLLSLIVGAANDNYMGDFKWRFSTTLNFLAHNLSRLGRLADVEVVVCDWNSEEPLHGVLTLSPAACELTRFVVVPPSLAQPKQLDSPFPIPIVQNTVIRRARGEFIGQTDSDVLYSCASLHSLLSVLDGTIPGIPARHAYLPAWRRHLPLAQVLRQSSLADLDEYVMRSGGQLAIDPPGAGYGAPTALALLHRDLWNACQGYDQHYMYWGWMDVDLALRIARRHPMLDLNNFGVNLVHMEHYVVRDYTSTQHQPRRVNFPDDRPKFVANGNDWGLAGETLQEFRAEPRTDDEGRIAGAARTIKPHTLEEVQPQIVSPGVAAVVSKVLERLGPTSELATCLASVAWAAQHLRPRIYVETGMITAHTAALAAVASPGVEIYAHVAWPTEVHDESSYAYGAHFALRNVLHGGFTRFLTGDGETAVAQLSSDEAKLPVDVALARVGLQRPVGNQQAKELAELIQPGGAMIVAGDEPASFAAAWQQLVVAHPSWTPMPFDDGRSGILLVV